MIFIFALSLKLLLLPFYTDCIISLLLRNSKEVIGHMDMLKNRLSFEKPTP